MKISIYPPLPIHEIGQRPNQEDAIAQWDNRLFVLCDGMGGHERGEVASQTVCQLLVKWFSENIVDDSFTDEQLHAALEYAYTELDKYDNGSPKKMGTTLTLLYIHNKGVTAAHIGDSRIYHIALTGNIVYQSRDHSLVFDLFQAGEISYDEMATFPQKNIVTCAMTPGKGNRMRPDIIHITYIAPEDYFYMCSDGMLEQMSNEELVNILFSDKSDEEKCNQLIAATAANQDNHSAWLIHVKNADDISGEDILSDEQLTARCNAINIIPKVTEGNEDDVVIVQEVKKTKTLLKKMKKVVDVIMNKKSQ
ncbi:MAG: serine/threonine-protein phosphatase [Prevotella sp.]|nr:serine/threonine-protein phosphatase [Prevotella sp.]